MKTTLKTIGFELEGEFSEAAIEDIDGSGYTDLAGDGSITSCCNHLRAREIRYGVFNNDKAGLKDIEEEIRKLKEWYDLDEYHFNSSMGFHIHLGFEPQLPPEIVFSKFSSFFLSRLSGKYPEAYRVRSRNKYCKVIGLCSDESILERHTRYRAINYLPALDKHGTVEFRIYPADSPETLKDYIDFTIKTVEEFLKKDIKLKYGVKTLDGIKTENINEKIELKEITRCVN